MNIAIFFRPVKVRLKVAYMADAYFDGFPQCQPENTFERIQEGLQESTLHPYQNMWVRIKNWYDSLEMYELSDEEIEQKFNTWRATGFKTQSGEDRTGIDLMNAKKRWEDRLWTRYEQKRSGRRSAAKIAAVPLLAFLGLPTGE